ncbi:unnamed protein product, partial [marine sediment metagenome]
MKLKKSQQIDHLYDVSKEIRGRFLDQAIPIEMLIDDIISWHFCPEDTRQSLFFSLVSPKLTFSNKIKILETILQIYYPDLVKKHQNLIKEINKIRDFRNRIAHSLLDASDEFLEKGYNDRIRLVFYRNGEKKHQVITMDNIKKTG